LNIPLGQGFGLGRPTVAADLTDSAAAWRTRDTLRPLRPRNPQTRLRVAAPAAEQEDGNGAGRIPVPGQTTRRAGDLKGHRLVRRSASSGKAL
jgi:hypothetical protein